jgi:hypothetical protein
MATLRYIGAALPRAHVMTITVANTWATNDTGDVICNGRTLRLTVGAVTTTTGIATAIAAMINGDAAIGTETRSETGDNVPEFQEVTAAASSSTVVITGNTKGLPFTFTVAENTAGSGTLSIAETTAATGPNHYDNAANWSTGALPVDNDTVIIEGDVDVLYGATQSSVTPAALRFLNFSGRFGLPDVNETGGYREYRTKFLAYGNSADAVNMAVTVDCESSRIRFNGGTGQVTINALNTGTPEDTEYAFEFKGSHTSNVINIVGGSVGVGIEPDDTTTVVATLRIGGNANAEARSGVGLTTVLHDSGTSRLASNVTTLTINDGDCRVDGTATLTTATVNGGRLNYRSSGTITNLYVFSNGEADFREDDRARTVSNFFIYGGGVVHDPSKTVTWTNGLDLIACGVDDVTLDIGRNQTLTPSAL